MCHHSWNCSEIVWVWHLGPWLSGDHGGAGGTQRPWSSFQTLTILWFSILPEAAASFSLSLTLPFQPTRDRDPQRAAPDPGGHHHAEGMVHHLETALCGEDSPGKPSHCGSSGGKLVLGKAQGEIGRSCYFWRNFLWISPSVVVSKGCFQCWASM